MKSIVVRLPEELHAKLRRVAFDSHVSMNSIMIEAIKEKIGPQKWGFIEKHRFKKAGDINGIFGYCELQLVHFIDERWRKPFFSFIEHFKKDTQSHFSLISWEYEVAMRLKVEIENIIDHAFLIRQELTK